MSDLFQVPTKPDSQALVSKVDAGFFENGKSLAREELTRFALEDSGKSYLRAAIESISAPYHRQDSSCIALKNLPLLALVKDPELSNAERVQMERQAIDSCRQAREREADAYSIVSGALKAAGLFMPGRSGYLLSSGSFALDEYNGKERLDLLQGALKGLATKKVVELMSGAKFSAGEQVLSLGIASRLVENGLRRENFQAEDGSFKAHSFRAGIEKTALATLSPLNLASDLAGFGLARTMAAPLAGIAGNAGLKTLGISSAFGFSAGLQEEANKQWQEGELNATRLIAFPLAKGLANAAFSTPAARSEHSIARLKESREKALDMEYKLVSVSGLDIKQLAGKPGESMRVKLRILKADGSLSPETSALVQGSNKAAVQVKDLDKSQLRFIGRSRDSNESSPWKMQIASEKDALPLSDLLASPGLRLRAGLQFGHIPGSVLAQIKEPATRLLGAGMQSLAVELAGGGVLKVSKTPWQSDWGRRAFDARLLSEPALFSDKSKAGSGGLSVYIQEPVLKASIWQYSKLSERIEKGSAFKFIDPKPAQTGLALRRHGEEVVLIDYPSVISRQK